MNRSEAFNLGKLYGVISMTIAFALFQWVGALPAIIVFAVISGIGSFWLSKKMD